MKGKAPLLLMEQMVMLLVFALAAALCLQAFVKSDEMSRHSEARDRALTEAQTVAETVRHCKGDMAQAAAMLDLDAAGWWDEEALGIQYDTQWAPAEPVSPGVYEFGYTLGVYRIESDTPGLGRAGIWVKYDESGEELVRFEFAWQEEVIAHAG